MLRASKEVSLEIDFDMLFFKINYSYISSSSVFLYQLKTQISLERQLKIFNRFFVVESVFFFEKFFFALSNFLILVLIVITFRLLNSLDFFSLSAIVGNQLRLSKRTFYSIYISIFIQL